MTPEPPCSDISHIAVSTRAGGRGQEWGGGGGGARKRKTGRECKIWSKDRKGKTATERKHAITAIHKLQFGHIPHYEHSVRPMWRALLVSSNNCVPWCTSLYSRIAHPTSFHSSQSPLPPPSLSPQPPYPPQFIHNSPDVAPIHNVTARKKKKVNIACQGFMNGILLCKWGRFTKQQHNMAA